jgi:glycosyltransferase involved in cell wall biosynthesis
LQKSIAIVANSDGLRKAAEAADDFPVRVIPNGTDQAVFDSKGAVLQVGRPLQILFVGRFRAQKNVAYLLRQVAQLPPGSFQLHLVGEGPDQQTLGELAVRLRIDRFITWHGWLSRSALRDVYCTADCLVNPSVYEGMPNVVLEAMAAGLPVIASNVPGNDELVKPGETGFLFELADGKDLRNALDALRDATVRARMGAAGRARARAWPTWEEVARRYLELFRGNGEPAAN